MKMVLYQALTRLWGKGRFSSWDLKTLDYLRSLGVDCLWLTGVPRHASGKPFVKGDPGCPYAISDWTDVNPYLADKPEERMHEFGLLVRRVHRKGLRLLIDFIPNHVARDYSGAVRHFDYGDPGWTDTLKNDWSTGETYEELLRVLRFWKGLGVDGFRCDMVELVPDHAMKGLIEAVKADWPDTLFVAEIYKKENYRHYIDYVGFDLLYDKSGLYDSLMAVCRDGASARSLTWNWQFLGDMQPRMLNFLENHDELRIASPLCLGSAEKGFAAAAVGLLFNEASFMLYSGGEVGEDAAESDNGRTSIFDITRPAGIGRLHRFVHTGAGLTGSEAAVLERWRSLVLLAKSPCFASGACWDLCYCNLASPGFDADRHFAFVRYNDSEAWLVVCNFSASPSRVCISFPPELTCLAAHAPVEVDVPAWDAQVVRL